MIKPPLSKHIDKKRGDVRASAGFNRKRISLNKTKGGEGGERPLVNSVVILMQA